MTIGSGTKLGPYEILSPLGAGGMGEVYRARDGKLNRDVAIKVLPEALARDADRLARFQREAQVLASLNHPHIAAIYGLEKSGDLEALVLELVGGETLAERIARGPLPVEEALAIGRQIADALEAAHEKGVGGVVSRDGHLFYVVFDQQGQHIWYRSLTDAKEKPAPFLPQSFYSIRPAPSPDGRFVAYEASPGPGNPEIFLRQFPPSEGVWQVSTNGGTSPCWSADGHLYFAKGPEIYEVSVTSAPDVRVSAPTLVFKRTAPAGGGVPSAFDVGPDGKRFLVYELAGEAPDDRMTVTLNWFAEMRPGGAAAGAPNR